MKKNIRRCAQCRLLNDRRLLLVLRQQRDGQLRWGANQPGRGLYLCPHPICLQRASKNKTLVRQFHELSWHDWQQACQQALQRLETYSA